MAHITNPTLNCGHAIALEQKDVSFLVFFYVILHGFDSNWHSCQSHFPLWKKLKILFSMDIGRDDIEVSSSWFHQNTFDIYFLRFVYLSAAFNPARVAT